MTAKTRIPPKCVENENILYELAFSTAKRSIDKGTKNTNLFVGLFLNTKSSMKMTI